MCHYTDDHVWQTCTCRTYISWFAAADIPVAAPVVGSEAAAASTSGGVGTSMLVGSSILSAIVACLAAVAIMMTVRYVRNRRSRTKAEKKFSNMQGRLSHATNLGFDAASSTNVSARDYDSESLSTVDVHID